MWAKKTPLCAGEEGGEPEPIFQGYCFLVTGGADRDRTDDLLNAIQALSQLSYSPTRD